MKHTLLKIFAAVVITLTALPLMAQDYMNVYFKDGTFRKFYMHNITEITTSQTDADGIKHADFDYQHVTTLYDTYVYCLDDVDYITFTKFNEEEAEQNLTQTINVTLPAISDCETITDMEEHIDEIKSAESVEDAWSDGHELFVKVKGWETISFHPNHDNEPDENARLAASRINTVLSSLAKIAISPNGRKPRVVIANQQHRDENRTWLTTTYFNPLIEKFRQCGIDVDYNDNPDFGFFYTNSKDGETGSIYDYDYVFLITHGSYSKIEKGEQLLHGIITSYQLGKIEESSITTELVNAIKDRVDKTRSYFEDATDQHISIGWCKELREGKEYYIPYLKLSELFFSDIATGQFTNPNSLLFNLACQSLKGNDNFANILLEKRNLGAYMGYTESNGIGQAAGTSFLSAMLEGKSVFQAYEGLQDICKAEHRTNSLGEEFVAELHIVSNDMANANRLFLAPVVTAPVDDAMTQYEADKAVTIKGTATTSNEEIGRGFIYGTERENLWTVVSLTNGKTIENTGDGNLTFESSMKNLESGTTYYYCAYTHDGKYYNYGDTLSFYIDYPKLVLEKNEMALEVGESGQIQVTSGSGSYSVWVYAPEVANVSVSGSTITVSALQGGKTVVQVTDEKSGHKVAFGVEVTWPNLVLAKNEMTLKVGESDQIQVTSGSGSYSVLAYAPEVALVSVSGNIITVTALKAGKTVVYVTDTNTEKRVAFGVLVKPDEVPANAVDLGLPSGTLWASYNIGAKKPEEYGGYFAWGETWEKDSYTWASYEHCDGSKDDCHDIGADIAGTDYDVAHMLWGGDWTMPTARQIDELTKYCTKTWTTLNGVKGCLVTGPNNNTIFLPAAGFKVGNSVNQAGTYGLYKSSTICDGDLAEAYELDADENNFVRIGTWNYYGYTVRPVITPAPIYVENADQPVDLGLTSGTLWAQCNLGAKQPQEIGNFYAWGETKPKAEFEEDNYAYYNSGTDSYTDIGSDISGTKYDAAHEALGGTWRMPTYDDFIELKNDCTWLFTTFNGVFGYRVTGPNGNSIFIPCNDDEDGFYWSSDLMEDAWSSVLHFSDEFVVYPHGYFRFIGMGIRPCKSK